MHSPRLHIAYEALILALTRHDIIAPVCAKGNQLKIDTEIRDDHQVKLTVEVEPDVLASAKRRAARQIAKRVKIPGFRPGKAPYNVVVKQVGEAAVLDDALDILLDDVYPQVIEEAEINPYGPGSLENIVSMEPPQFEFMVPLAPEIDLGDYRALRAPYEPSQVTEKDVESFLGRLQDQQAVNEPAERPAQEGDIVYLALSAERAKADEGEDATLIEERRLPVIIEGEDVDDSDEWPYPGFSRQLTGLAAGDEKSTTYAYPEDSEFERLRGTEAKFQVKVEEVKAHILPELDDAFAQSVGDYETIDELRAKVKESLEQQAAAEYDAEYASQVIEQIIEQATLKYPPQLLKREIDDFVAQMERRLAGQGLDIDTYLKSRELDMEAWREEIKPSAEQRVQRSLVIMEVAKLEGIKVTSEEVQHLTQHRVDELNQMLPPEQVQKLLQGDAMQGLVSQVVSDEITGRTLERLRMIGKGEPLPEPGEPAEDEGLIVESEAGEATDEPPEEALVEETVAQAEEPVAEEIVEEPEAKGQDQSE